MPSEGHTECNGLELHYLDWGGEGPGLLLLGGIGGTAHLFRSLAPRLAERFRVVALTRRGHGRSERTESGYDLETLVEDIRCFLDVRGLDSVVLVGHSFAGFEMTRFAVRHPERVRAIVYLDALDPALAPLPDGSKNPAWSAVDVVPDESDLRSPESFLAYFRRARADLAEIWCGAVEADRVADMTIANGRPVNDHHGSQIAPQMFDGLGPEPAPDYGAVSAPMLALVCGGTANPFVFPDAPEELRSAADAYWLRSFVPWQRRRTEVFHAAAPGARVVALDTSNHTLFIAREDETVRAIFEFIPEAAP